jgi:ABC-type phosphate/phosphonate transport system substrate-binding protein
VIAALPMYDFEDMTAANDAFWAQVANGLRAAGVAAPAHLTRGRDLWDIWQSPDLVLAQTCGYPFRARLAPHVGLVGTPDYAVEGCAPGYYCSLFIARATDPRSDLAAFDGTPLAYNEAMSQSGWAAPQNHAAQHGLHFPAGPLTGAHRETALAIADGRADLGAVDAVTWRHLQRAEPGVAGLRVVARTTPTPGLPFITARQNPAGVIFDVLAQTIAELPPEMRAILGLRGIVAVPAADYAAVPNPAPPA